MISCDEALALIEQQVIPLESETLPLEEAHGRVVAEAVTARSAAPRRAVSAMDGYAVSAAHLSPGRAYRVIGETRPGRPFSGSAGFDQVVRIFTGAQMPEGTDFVVMQEYATRAGDDVTFAPGYGPASYVRAAGSDFLAGATLIAAGTRLTPRALVAAAAADRAEVRVARRPRVAIFATGDELAPPGSAFRVEGAVPDSVSLALAALTTECGGDVLSRVIAADDLDALTLAAGDALTGADLVVVSGGASVGERDFAKPMFAPHGLALLFDKVAVKPGKPVWLGRAAGAWVLGLPGNPTSAMVTAALFLRPVLAGLQGHREAREWRSLPLAAPLAETGDRETFVRARWAQAGLVPLANQDSGAQAGLAQADWLIRCPPGQSAMPAGVAVACTPF